MPWYCDRYLTCRICSSSHSNFTSTLLLIPKTVAHLGRSELLFTPLSRSRRQHLAHFLGWGTQDERNSLEQAIQFILLPPQIPHMEYISHISKTLYLLNLGSSFFQSNELQNKYHIPGQISLNRLRYFDRIRLPSTRLTVFLNVSNTIRVGWVYCAGDLVTIEALHVTTHAVIGYSRSYRFYYFEGDW